MESKVRVSADIGMLLLNTGDQGLSLLISVTTNLIYKSDI